ncbi:MAG TPA: amidoligase family protein [Candidatus Hydrogenedentes bacterium]|nr:amidoligase family protein [Candidatus Hydrogenedentota bacterium]
MVQMCELTYGIEIETVGQDRRSIAEAIRTVVGGEMRFVGGAYDAWTVTAADGRKWSAVRDASLSSVTSAEIVSPILRYEDLQILQDVVRAVRAIGARVDSSTGIHIHIGAAPFNTAALVRLAKLVYKQEPLIYKALGIRYAREVRFAKPISPEFITKLERERPATMRDLNQAWYGFRNEHPFHYDQTRYCGVNFHNVWFRGTVEFRWFESTLHAGKVKAYVQFVLAIALKALNSKAAGSAKRAFNPACAKYDFRVWLLRLGMIGDEFKTARKHLLGLMPGDAAFKGGRPARPAVVIERAEAAPTAAPALAEVV